MTQALYILGRTIEKLARSPLRIPTQSPPYIQDTLPGSLHFSFLLSNCQLFHQVALNLDVTSPRTSNEVEAMFLLSH